MSKKVIIFIFIVLIAILGVFSLYADDTSSVGSNQEKLNVSSEGPLNLSDLVEDIKTHECYEGYDNKTVKWMESLGEKYVWTSLDYFVIMDSKSDSDKIPSIYPCDVAFEEIFACDVLEKHSLGDVDHTRDVLLVKNVEYIGEKAYYFDV